jgi:hypothetical protein
MTSRGAIVLSSGCLRRLQAKANRVALSRPVSAGITQLRVTGPSESVVLGQLNERVGTRMGSHL